jgi:hypothetical protein
VALTNVVVFATPLKFTTELAAKLVPFTVRVKATPPLVALEGKTEVIVGRGLLTVNGEVPEVPPPGAGFVTVTLTEPAAAISAAVMDAVNFVPLTNVVVVAVPLKFTTEDGTKLVPFTVSVKAAVPAVALVGEIEVMVGTGLLTANGEAPDVPPPGAGFVTVTLNVPAVAISATVIAAVNCVALTKVVVVAVPLKVTTEEELKFAPFTVKVNADPPARANVGESELIAGNGLLTVNEELADVPPPGAGLVTVTPRVPAVAMSGAVIGAVTCVASTNVVVLGVPLKFTTEPETKPVPFTVSVKAEPPAIALLGNSEVITGAGLLTANDELAEVPPPGAELVTVTGKLPTAEMSASVTDPVNCVGLTNVVALAAPLKLTMEVETNPVPFTVNAKADPPTVAVVGESVVMAGTGLLTVNVWPAEVPPPGNGFVTVTVSGPPTTSWLPGIVMVIVAPPFDAVPPVSPLEPKFTIEPAMKPVPVSVSVTGWPATPLVGLIEVSVGTGFGWLAIVKTKFVVVPPPGAGFVTVTFADPTAEMSDERIEAVSFVALTNVVAFAVPLKFTTELVRKLVPLTVRVKPAPPAVTPFGLSDEIVGAGLFIANGEFPEVPPPGAGLVTVTLTDSAVRISAAVSAAVIWVALTNVVVLGFPLKLTTEPERKFVPFTVNVKAAPPTIAPAGDRDVIAGNGLFTVNDEFPDVPPPGAGFVTATLKVPATVMSVAKIAAVT